MAHAERLLACPSCGSSSLRGVLLARGINVAGDALSIPRSPAAAARARDMVAQCLYAALFAWLVQRINAALELHAEAAALGGAAAEMLPARNQLTVSAWVTLQLSACNGNSSMATSGMCQAAKSI